MNIRKSKTQIPIGWTPVYRNNKRYYRCPKLQKTLNEEVRRCSYTCRKYLISNGHKCRFDIPEAHDTINEREKHFIQIKSIEAINELILFDLCYLAGRLDISSNKACSEAMHTFINKILKYGLLLHTQNPNINSIPKEVGHYDTKRFSKQLQAISKEEFQSTLKLCKSIRYINLAVDAGTVLQYHCLHSLITNPYYDQFPRLLETYEIKIAYTAEQYSEYFSIVTSQLIELGIQICGIVIDNLPVQVKGLNDWITNNQDNRVRAIVHVPCLAHSLNLVFTNTYKDNYLLHKITNNIIELSSMLRTTKAINFIGKICPLPIKTRWFYVCDIISFVFDNKNEIESYMLATKPDLSEYIISNKINLLHQILYPVRYLILIFEKTSAHLWQLVEATKKFQEMMNHSWELIRNEDEEWKELFKVIIARTLSRISTTCHDEVITGYVLSLNGRDEIRQIQHGMRGFNMSNSVHSHGMLFPDISNQYQLDSHEENVNVDNSMMKSSPQELMSIKSKKS